MRLTKDLVSGVLFVVLGLGALMVARQYSLGTPTRMGPGFFPMILGGLISIIGIIMIVKSLLARSTGEVIGTIKLRPLFFLSLAIIAFGLLIESAGMIVALLCLIVIARFANTEGTVSELAFMVVVLTALAYLIFVQALHVRFPVVPW